MKFHFFLATAIALGACGGSADSLSRNSKSGAGDVLLARAFGSPDLVVSEVTQTPLHPVSGDLVTFQITVANVGDEKSPGGTVISTAIYDQDVPPIAVSNVSKGALQPGATVVLTTTAPWPAIAGSHTLRAVVDFDNIIGESNESNNETTFSLEVAAGEKLPDLLVTGFSQSPLHPAANEAVSFTATIKNQGTAATPAGTVLGVAFRAQDGSLLAMADSYTNELAPGESVAITTTQSWTAVEGIHQITAVVDDANRIQESDEGNNQFVQELEVSAPVAPPAPDLVVTSYTYAPSAPKEGDVVTFTAMVKNVGTGPTPAGVILGVGFRDANNTAIAFSDTHTQSLAAGSSVALTSNKTWTAVLGTHDVTAYVDDVNRIAELDETNNKLTKALTAAPKPEVGTPDLTITGFTYSPASPKEGDAISFTVSVKNIGTEPVPSGVILGVGFRKDGQGNALAVSDTHTGGLAAGATLQLTTNKLWTATAGAHSIEAHVDDVDRIVEGNETNNRYTKTTTVAAPTTTEPAPSNAKAAYRFIDTIGVNTHFAFTSTPAYTNYSSVKSRLLELGVKHIRDGSGSASGYKVGGRSTQVWNDLATYGIKLNMIGNHRWTATDIIDVLNANKASIVSIEGQNEPDLFVDGDWVTAARTFQKRLWQTVKGSSYAHIPVLNTALAGSSRYATLGDLSAYANYGNIHSYNGGRTPLANLDFQLTNVKNTAGNAPVMSTETGYHTALQTTSTHLPISDRGMAKYIPRLFLDYFNKGIARTYQYQLYDHLTPSTSNKEANFGLVRRDLSVKQAFINLRNMIAILKDSSAQVPGGMLSYSLSGNTANVRSTLLQKSNGKFYLVLWQDVSVWDRNARKDIYNADVGVSVNFASTKTTALYKPSVSAQAQSTRSGTSVTVNVPDEVVILEIQ